MVPLTAPFHLVVSVAEADVLAGPAHTIGLLAKDPETVALVIDTAPLLVEQSLSFPVTIDGLVPPPELVNGGENDIFPANVHVT
jgi:hypothetical protein